MSVLLTDEAVRVADRANYAVDRHEHTADESLAAMGDALEAFLHHHATVGREALVEKVAAVMLDAEQRSQDIGDTADDVITALVGGKRKRPA